MRVFRDFLYVDEVLLNTCAVQIGVHFSEMELSERETTSGSLKGSVGIVGGDTTLTSESSTKKHVSYSFEAMLAKLESTLAEEDGIIQVDTVFVDTFIPGTMVRATGAAELPELFENIDTLRQVMPFMGQAPLLSQIEAGNEDLAEVFIERILSGSEAIPLTITDSGVAVVLEAKEALLINSSKDFLDRLESEVSLIGIVQKVCCKGSSLESFDLLKSIGFGRAARREVSKNSENPEQFTVHVDYPAIKVNPIAIWI